jgi:hypothetical protein
VSARKTEVNKRKLTEVLHPILKTEIDGSLSPLSLGIKTGKVRFDD